MKILKRLFDLRGLLVISLIFYALSSYSEDSPKSTLLELKNLKLVIENNLENNSGQYTLGKSDTNDLIDGITVPLNTSVTNVGVIKVYDSTGELLYKLTPKLVAEKVTWSCINLKLDKAC